MSWVEVSSESIGMGGVSYHVAKYPIRRRFALVRDTTFFEPVAYFRSEAQALQFCADFGLRVTDYRGAL